MALNLAQQEDFERPPNLARPLEAAQAPSLVEGRNCIDHLTGSLVKDGERQVRVGDLVREACGAVGDNAASATRVLLGLGLRFLYLDSRWYLAVANRSNSLSALFHETRWQAYQGSGHRWSRALRALPAVNAAPKPIRFGFGQSRAILVPLELIDPVFDSQTGRFQI